MSLDVPESIHLVEMLPRDGFQRLDRFVPTEEKVEIIDLLSETGVDEIEITSFTHPKAVPNLRDADTVAESIERRDGITYRALVPNAVGMERAIDAGVDKVNALVTVSETYSQHNQHMSVSEILDEVVAIVELAEGTPIEVEAGMGTSFYCPYEGRIPPSRTEEVIASVVEAGVDEVTLATTMGLANPVQVSEMFESVTGRWPEMDFGLHLHDTNGMSLANTLVAMQHGIDRFDTSIAGLGGGVVLPDALAGIGNTPTEDLVQMIDEMGLETAADRATVESVATTIADRLDLGTTSHVLKGGTIDSVLETVANSNR